MLSYPVRIALIAALGGFLFGFETVVISGAEQTLEHLWQLSRFSQGFTVSSSLIGTIASAFTISQAQSTLEFFLSGSMAKVITLLAIVGILMLRPQGLFALKIRK